MFCTKKTNLLEFFPMLTLIVKLKVQSYGLANCCFAKKMKGELTGAWLHLKLLFFFQPNNFKFITFV
jgi:hypothetical protein